MDFAISGLEKHFIYSNIAAPLFKSMDENEMVTFGDQKMKLREFRKMEKTEQIVLSREPNGEILAQKRKDYETDWKNALFDATGNALHPDGTRTVIVKPGAFEAFSLLSHQKKWEEIEKHRQLRRSMLLESEKQKNEKAERKKEKNKRKKDKKNMKKLMEMGEDLEEKTAEKKEEDLMICKAFEKCHVAQ